MPYISMAGILKLAIPTKTGSHYEVLMLFNYMIFIVNM
jgi:hypothetical protein